MGGGWTFVETSGEQQQEERPVRDAFRQSNVQQYLLVPHPVSVADGRVNGMARIIVVLMRLRQRTAGGALRIRLIEGGENA